MSNKKNRNKYLGKDKSKSGIVECPLCHAHMYPRQYTNPVSKSQEEAIICASCNTDLKPYIDAYIEYANKSAEAKLKEPTVEDAEFQVINVKPEPTIENQLLKDSKDFKIVSQSISETEYSKVVTESYEGTGEVKPKRNYTKKKK